MKKVPRYARVLIIGFIGLTVQATINTLSLPPETPPAIEYRSVCRNLPANAHRTSNESTRKEIPQTETSPNVREPNPVGTYSGANSDTECFFLCDKGYGRDVTNNVCTSKYPDCDMIDITIGDYTISACNVGTNVAGTGVASYGNLYQWGNNYGFANAGNLTPAPSSTQQNTTGKGPNNPYSSNLFIYGENHCDWSKTKNDNLRGGTQDDGPNTISVGQSAKDRQGPCATGYYIPSQGERNQLLISRAIKNNISVSTTNGYASFTNSEKVSQFTNDFLLPRVGARTYSSKDATVYNQGGWGYYSSSSPNGSNVRFFFFDENEITAKKNDYCRGNATSVRCFKDTP